MKKFIIIVFIIIIMLNINVVYGKDTEEVIKDQEKSLDIPNFIQNAEKYTKDTFKNINLKDVYKEALKGETNTKGFFSNILNLLGTETLKTIKTLGTIIAIIIIHSIIKSISEGMENEKIGEITYYVQYILIVTLIMSNFSEMIVMIKDTINSLVGFINSLLPILLALMMATRKYCYYIYGRTNSFNDYYIYW